MYEHDPEYCRKVAEACGLEVATSPDFVPEDADECWVPCRPSSKNNFSDVRIFLPDEDWNDAMLAAEKVGLFFGDPDAILLAGCHPNWLVYWIDAKEPTEHRVEHESGPRAICDAILKLAEARKKRPPQDTIS